jgi:NAD+ synthase (glutamine-hydrolysing)
VERVGSVSRDMAGPVPPLRLAMAQLDVVVGDLEGNAAKISRNIEAARDGGAELVLIPEMAVTGYPPEDLLLREHFLRDAREALDAIAADVAGIVAIVGFPERGQDVFNSIAVVCDGDVKAIYRKTRLWNYGVADEERYFQAGDGAAVIDLGDTRIGLTICEDIWVPGAPASDEALAGASLIVNPSASPYQHGKGIARERMLAQRARDNLSAVAFCNLVGGQDELVFDGHSVVLDHEGRLIARAPQFAESLTFATVDVQRALTARLRDTRLRPPVHRMVPDVRHAGTLPRSPAAARPGCAVAELLEEEAEVYAALVLGTRDYVEKNGFQRVVIGLSGGIDSTLVSLIAVDALGADRVTCVSMPSRYSSSGTKDDARALAESLEVEFLEVPIGQAMEIYDELLAERFGDREPDITEENLQARIRGNLLMALSNKFGWLVLTTGNKSETSVGYSTLYGDTAGGFAVIKDVPKTLVYRLVDFRNARDEEHPVPRSIIDRPPSAELRPHQQDQDSLPDYDTLDRILEAYIEEDADREQLIAVGLPEQAVDRVLALVDRAEYKRRQAPPGVKITPRAFGRDRRMPITNRYRG